MDYYYIKTLDYDSNDLFVSGLPEEVLHLACKRCKQTYGHKAKKADERIIAFKCACGNGPKHYQVGVWIKCCDEADIRRRPMTSYFEDGTWKNVPFLGAVCGNCGT